MANTKRHAEYGQPQWRVRRIEHGEFVREVTDIGAYWRDDRDLPSAGTAAPDPALRLALELIPDHLDLIIGLSHDPDLLHLDTGFTVLPNRVMLDDRLQQAVARSRRDELPVGE